MLIPTATRCWGANREWGLGLIGAAGKKEKATVQGPTMGMDVSGRNPSSPAGGYFRANIWSWRPIHALIIELCSDILDEETLTGMAFNDGAGPQDQKTCTEMAKRFEQWMEHHTEGHGLESDLRITEDGRFVNPEELAENPALETDSPYDVHDEHLKEWIEFLRYCGGFEVW